MYVDIIDLIKDLFAEAELQVKAPQRKRLQSFLWSECMKNKLIEEYKKNNGNVRLTHELAFPQLELCYVRNYVFSLRKAKRIV